ncbi:bifunctional 4-hydroxy-2-oxoglutarate aldolase/2-dehydro-3-deoxy-phosphogluconate aldolase [Paenibacillus lutimineralis]|uniref:Bifunctional 4-hydroxy-2-oxoglutarate aldolase/2-dehydro-3-deoxy-phosphogluconate aldolase n=1 Tax=Paenibacillus lutimineralis TaxID=2707005 RepID=A0A3S9V190_9BACL|nr:bifunctional 4-hydroxy-2-oxoglutarate aldolase/2-dehydro-3-deoxy-phosphogluconate aldolase [Paenibacillus lutimineralis]AZS16280.1 bifunctional 4-hydroxy-2-oxoglutarate aldolase/2-dehydro-3-deoxy-phosphogluconate aldolase [Paenibacillus lutimineralis]
MSILEVLNREKIMAMIRGLRPDTVDRTVEALVQGGIRFLEVTTNTEGVYELVERLRQRYEGQLLIGIGTVLDADMAAKSIDAGAQFIVSPNLDEEVISYGLRHEIDVFPGVMTPTEIVRAVKVGAKAVKVFPTGSLGGAAYLKEIRAPLDHIPMIASGSVGLNNLRDILDAGAIGVGIGGNLVKRQWIEAERFNEIQKLAREFVDIVAEFQAQSTGVLLSSSMVMEDPQGSGS